MSTTGKYLQTKVGNTVFCPRIVKWSAEETGEVLDATSAASAGYEDNDDGPTGVHISVEFLFDLVDGPFPTIGKGALLTNFIALGNAGQTNPPDYKLPVAIITEPGRAVEVRGQIKGNFKVRNKGYFERDGLAART